MAAVAAIAAMTAVASRRGFDARRRWRSAKIRPPAPSGSVPVVLLHLDAPGTREQENAADVRAKSGLALA
jgi:hypothetical protein